MDASHCCFTEPPLRWCKYSASGRNVFFRLRIRKKGLLTLLPSMMFSWGHVTPVTIFLLTLFFLAGCLAGRRRFANGASCCVTFMNIWPSWARPPRILGMESVAATT